MMRSGFCKENEEVKNCGSCKKRHPRSACTWPLEPAHTS
jgi:hypothetical protein